MFELFSQKINKAVNWFMPKKKYVAQEIYRRARLLVLMHFFALLATIIIGTINLFQINGDLFCPLIVFLGFLISLFVFKKRGSLTLTGNIFALIPAIGLLPLIFEQGGMYSDNLLWLYMSPLIAFLFTNKRSRMTWYFVTAFFHCFLFALELNSETSFQNQMPVNDPFYYFCSYFILFLVLFIIIYLFRSGQERIIEALQEQRNLLLKQKKEIELQANILKQQEEKLKKMNTELEQFAFVVSHDLKEPLRTIGSFTKLLNKELNGKQTPTGKEYMGYVLDGVMRMNTLINNVLGDIKNKRKEAQMINLNEVMMVVVNNLSGAVLEKKADISYQDLPTVKGQATAYVQLFQNLISNSLKFQKEGALPKIHVFTSKINGSYYIKVTDNGIGIPKEQLPNIFTLFNQGNTGKSHFGQGIGLATCQKIARRFGGNISVDSTLEQGTTFTIKLPRDTASFVS